MTNDDDSNQSEQQIRQNFLEEAAILLTQNVKELNESVENATAVRDELQLLDRRGVTNRRLIIVTVIGLILDILLSIATIFIYIRQTDTINNVNGITNRLDTAQTTTRSQALCPLYQLFIDQLNKTKPSPQQGIVALNIYNNQVKIVNNGYNVLQCDKYLHK